MKKKSKARKLSTALNRTRSSKANTCLTEFPSKSIPIDLKNKVPLKVRQTVQRLHEAGYIAYLVGGCVRDLLLNYIPKDFDIATNATPDQVGELFEHASFVGKHFGVVKVFLEGPENSVEVATFRKDGHYQDARHPDQVEFSSAAIDSQRRDFTVNALFYDLKKDCIIDYVDGYSDLKAKIIRAIGQPRQRFQEDALRLMRAIRFSSVLDFTIEENTSKAIEVKSDIITRISVERISEELTKMLLHPSAARSIQLLYDLGLLKRILPEVEALRHLGHEAWKNTLNVLREIHQGRSNIRLDKNITKTLAWAALLHDIGKVIIFEKTNKRQYKFHEKEGALLAEALLKRLKFSNHDVHEIVQMIEQHRRFHEAFHMRDSSLVRFVTQPNFLSLAELHRADMLASDGNLAFYEFCIRLHELHTERQTHLKIKLIDGNDLIALGLKPGPEFSNILEAVQDYCIEGKINTKEEAFEWILNNKV